MKTRTRTRWRNDTQMPTGAQLESWSGYDWDDGVQVDALHELDHLSVRTRNSTYEILVRNPSSCDVLVRGGSRFPTYTPARLCGCSVGGTVLKRGGIYPGFRLELELDGRRLLTSAVESVDVDPPAREQ